MKERKEEVNFQMFTAQYKQETKYKAEKLNQLQMLLLGSLIYSFINQCLHVHRKLIPGLKIQHQFQKRRGGRFEGIFKIGSIG